MVRGKVTTEAWIEKGNVAGFRDGRERGPGTKDWGWLLKLEEVRRQILASRLQEEMQSWQHLNVSPLRPMPAADLQTCRITHLYW